MSPSAHKALLNAGYVLETDGNGFSLYVNHPGSSGVEYASFEGEPVLGWDEYGYFFTQEERDAGLEGTSCSVREAIKWAVSRSR